MKTWLVGRLSRMSAEELKFRLGESARTAAEFMAYASGSARWKREGLLDRLDASSAPLEAARQALVARDWLTADQGLRAHFSRRPSRFVIDPARRETVAAAVRTEFPTAAAAAAARADRILDGRYDLLGYRDLSFELEGRFDWQLDPVHGRRAAGGFWKRVPYLDPQCGDHKVIWEFNRHQHLLALGRASWLTGDPRYRDACIRQMASWMEANPPLTGINWASMLELAFRTVSWVWALHLFVGNEDEPQVPWVVDLLVGIDRQFEHISGHLSRYFSPNTHLLGEALALYVGGSALPELRGSTRWRNLGRRVLLRETTAQVHADGGHAELSAHYHRYALDFYLLALIISRRTGDTEAEAAFAEVTSRMASFCRALADGRGRLPLLGDDDGGMLFPMCGREPADASDTLSLAASLLARPELATDDPPEEALWMLGGDRSALTRPAESFRPASHHFEDTGYIVLRAPGEHLVLDAGRHGFLNGGHAHADALSIVLSVDDRPLLVDPGTATYIMDAATRDWYRSSAMHNTLVVDGRSQSEPRGPFHWRTRAEARVDLWRPGAAFDFAEASHAAYSPIVHRRGVLATRERLWVIVDHVLAEGRHRVASNWHLHPAWRANGNDPSAAQFIDGGGRWAAIASTFQQGQEHRGGANGQGWWSPAYGRVEPASVLTFTDTTSGPSSFVSAISVGTSPRGLSIALLPVTADAADGWHRVAVAIASGSGRHIVLFATPASAAWAESPRSPSRVVTDAGELATDARVALLHLSSAGEPLSLSLVDSQAALWTGDPPVTLRLPAPAADLHLDIAAQRRLSRADESQRLG